MSAPNPAELQRRIVECAGLARAVDVRPFELDSAEAVACGLVPPVVASLECAISLCLEALEAYDPEETPPADADDPFADDGRSSSVFHVDVDALLRRTDGERQVADVAFLGVTELRPKLNRIRSLPPTADPWEAVAECGSAIRRIGKSLTALELAVCRLAGLTPQLGHATQLSRSLEVRRQYQRLRQSCAVQPSDETLERALRSAGTAIAVLIGKRIYPDLRVHDRRQIRDLQGRIIEWLKSEADETQRLREGKRLWQDFVGFADLITHVSRRQELVEHDALVLARATEELAPGNAGRVGDELFELLETLIGLDPEVDRLLAAGTRELSAWRPAITRLHAERAVAVLDARSFPTSTPVGHAAGRGADR